MKTVKILLLIFGLGLGAGALSWAAGGSYRFMASAMARREPQPAATRALRTVKFSMRIL